MTRLVALFLMLAVVLVMMGCADRVRDPMAVYFIDPKAFQFFVVGF